MPLRFLITSTLCMLVFSYSSSAEDRTAVRVEAAEERFEKAVQRVSERLSASLKEEVEKARADGDLDKLVVLQEEKRLYDEKHLIPRHSAVSNDSKSYYRTLDREGDKLERAYEDAIKSYIQSGDVKAAKEIEARMEWLRPMKGLKTIEFGDHYYLLIEETVSWQDAQSRCLEMGGYLGCVNSEKENLLFHRLGGEGRHIRLGYNDDAKEGQWVGADGTIMKYKNWQPGEPNGGRATNWAVMMGNGKWDDIGSRWGNVTAFVCEWDYKITRRSPNNSDSSGTPEARPNQLVIWNSHQGDRGVGICDVVLKKSGQRVDVVKGVELEMRAGKAIRNDINLPNVDFDELEIQVLGWHGHSAGITEIALMHGTSNVTGSFLISVDHDRSNKYYDPKNMIDGDHQSEWFPNDGSRCQINFKAKQAGQQDPGLASPEAQLVKAATLKHNELIVAERDSLQKAILNAEEVQAIEDAKSNYNLRVATIKESYIGQLKKALESAIAGDKLEIAGKIKTQILRVRKQIEALSREGAESDVPAIDAGGEVAAKPEPKPANPVADNTEDDPSDKGDDGPDFFGLPLE